MTSTKILYMLIGPKGSGKTHIGTLVGRHTNIYFLRVEPIWLSLRPTEDGWEKVARMIDELFQAHDQVMIESLGAGEGFRKFHAALTQKYLIRMIRVYADLETCFNRVKNRDNFEHIPVSDEQVMEYNKTAVGVAYDWALEIDNTELASDGNILEAIRSINRESFK